MVDVFISYSSKDRDKARAMAKVLEARGLTVWWDRSILPGESFDDAIERAIADARCLVVLWSNHSVQSRWVRNEASEGERRGVLVPALLEEAPIPLQFRSMQAADLRNWDAVSFHGELEALTRAIQQIVSRSMAVGPEEPFKRPQLPPEALPKAELTQLPKAQNPPPLDDHAFYHSPKHSPQPQTSMAGIGLVAIAIVGILLAGLLFMNLTSPNPVSTTYYSNQPTSTEPSTGLMPSATTHQAADVEKMPVKSAPPSVAMPSPKTSASIGTHTYIEPVSESNTPTVATQSANPVKTQPRIDSSLVARSSTNGGTAGPVRFVPTNLDARKSDLYRMFLSQYGTLRTSTFVPGTFKLMSQEGDKRRLLNGELVLEDTVDKSCYYIYSIVTADGSGTIPDESGSLLRYENNTWNLYRLTDDGSEVQTTGVVIRTDGNRLVWYSRGSSSEELVVWERKQNSDVQDQFLGEELSRTQKIASRRFIKHMMTSESFKNTAKTQHEIGMAFRRNFRAY